MVLFFYVLNFSVLMLEGGTDLDLHRFKVKCCLVWHSSPKVGESGSLGFLISLILTSSILNDSILPNVLMSILSISALASSSSSVTAFKIETGSGASSFDLATTHIIKKPMIRYFKSKYLIYHWSILEFLGFSGVKSAALGSKVSSVELFDFWPGKNWLWFISNGWFELLI